MRRMSINDATVLRRREGMRSLRIAPSFFFGGGGHGPPWECKANETLETNCYPFFFLVLFQELGARLCDDGGKI